MRGHSTWLPRLWTCHQNRGKQYALVSPRPLPCKASISHTHAQEKIQSNITDSPNTSLLGKMLDDPVWACFKKLCRGKAAWMLNYCSIEVNVNTFSKRWWAHLALMRYWARLMLAGVPVMVIWRSDDPSMALAILIWAPDIWRISLILVPWRPIMQPISWEESVKVRKRLSKRKR